MVAGAKLESIEPRWIRPSHWKRITGMTHTETYRRIDRGDLRSVRVGKAIYIPASEIEAFFERARKAA